jgi:hypothetical protein
MIVCKHREIEACAFCGEPTNKRYVKFSSRLTTETSEDWIHLCDDCAVELREAIRIERRRMKKWVTE